MSNQESLPHTSRNTLGIIAGGGQLPKRIVETARHQDRPVFILAYENATDPALVEDVPHAWVRLGAVGTALEALRNAGVQELVMAGHMKRPSLPNIRPDLTATRLLARLGTAFFAGDDRLLKTIIAFLEEEGFRVVSPQSILGSLLATSGVYGKHQPNAQAKQDIATGFHAAHLLGALDIGQAVMVENGYILAVEAAEGTDALIQRSQSLMREPGKAVLIKACKPQQEKRVDLPTIGVSTVEACHRAGCAGIAVQSGGTLLVDRDKMIAMADTLGLFLIGYDVANP